MLFYGVSVADFEQINVSYEVIAQTLVRKI